MPRLSPGHRQALEELRLLEDRKPGALQVLKVAGSPDAYGWLAVELSLDCAATPPGLGGVQLEPRETVTAYVPAEFPFIAPEAEVRHDRFAGLPHVQWRRALCLYQADADWDASDGMLGFVTRLADWYLHAAFGTLDEPGQPLHPPVAYASRTAGCVVVHADAPGLAGDDQAAAPWLGAGVLRGVNDDRADVIGWLKLAEALPADTSSLRSLLTRIEALEQQGGGHPVFLAPAVMLPSPISFEFPDTVARLVDALADQGVTPTTLVELLGSIAIVNGLLARPPAAAELSGEPAPAQLVPLYAIVGSPMRGVAGGSRRLAHLAVWRLDEGDSVLAPRLVELWESEDPGATEARRDAIDRIEAWIEAAWTSWAMVYEQRPEIVVRRDIGRPAAWLQGRRVVILGCGALGAPIAEHCVRAGAAELVLVDWGRVHPGILVRQPYHDGDIGMSKVLALARRLRSIRPEASVIAVPGDALHAAQDELVDLSKAELVVDATASLTVAAKLELDRWSSRVIWPPILTIGIGHHAERGLATLALPTASGGGSDVLRRVGLAAHADGRLADVATDLFPDTPRAEVFQPEPGCSEPTFLGSASEVAALAAHLLTAALGALASHAAGVRVAPMSAWTVRLVSPPPAITAGPDHLSWNNDVVVDDLESGYQIRFAASALRSMADEAQTTSQLYGPDFETGGVLVGRIDAACRVIWVTAADGPSPDSEQSPRHFRHGVEGVEERIAVHRQASGGAVRFVGIWHTHPYALPFPSPTDQQAMSNLLVPIDRAPPRALLVILGGRPGQWRSWLHGVGLPTVFARLVTRTETMTPRAPHPTSASTSTSSRPV